MLYEIGENIDAGASVICDMSDGKLYSAGERSGNYIGDAAEQLREGFRAVVRRGQVREDDA